MTTSNEKAMRLALEALKTAQNNLAPSKHSAHVYGDGELWDEYDEAIKALEIALSEREALAKQSTECVEQRSVSKQLGEPVAVIVEKTESSRITGADFGVGCSDGFIKYSYKTAQFYPTGKKTITNFDVTWNEVLEAGTLLYTTPPSMKCEGPQQRTWVGLTDDEVKKIAYNSIEVKVARTIEAKLKEKNT